MLELRIKQIFLAFVFLHIASSLCFSNTIEKIDFSTSYTKALKKALKEDKFVFAYVYTEWSVPCKKMDETTFKDSTVIHELNQDYVPLIINAGRKKTFVKDYEVHIFPSFMVIDKWGNAIIRGSGYKSPEDLMRMIYKTRSKSRYLRQSIDSLLIESNPSNILSIIDSVKYYKDDYTSKNLAKKYLDKKKKKNWGDKECMILLNEYFTLDEKYVKFVSRNHHVFFMVFDSTKLKENISFHVFLNSLKSDGRGRSRFDFKPLKKWFKKYKLHGYDKMENFVRIKYLLWGRGPSVRSSIRLIENYPETSNESVLYSSVIRILLDNTYRREIDYDELVRSIESSIEEGNYWRYDVLALLYYKMGNQRKVEECISTAREIADILGEEYTPILDYLKEHIDQ